MMFYLNWWLWSKSSRKQTLLKMSTNWKFPERSLQKHQNTDPKVPVLWLSSDMISGNSNGIYDHQLNTVAVGAHKKPGAPVQPWCCGLPQEACPKSQLNVRECKSSSSPASAKTLSTSRHGNQNGIQASRIFLLLALQQVGSGSSRPLAGVLSPQALDNPQCPWTGYSRTEVAALPGLTFQEMTQEKGELNLARTPNGVTPIKTFQGQKMCYFQLNFVSPINL